MATLKSKSDDVSGHSMPKAQGAPLLEDIDRREVSATIDKGSVRSLVSKAAWSETDVVVVDEELKEWRPPDGGWGWVVVLGSFISHMVIGGVERSGGVLYLQWIERFESSATATAWVASLGSGLRLFCGPLSSVLCDKFGFRLVVLIGSLTAAVSSILCAFSPELYFVHLSFGVLGGIGRGLCYTPSVVVVGLYFDKKRGLAVGLASAGVGISSFFLPPLLDYLFKVFGYSGAFILISGFFLQICISAMLYRQLEDNSPRPKKEAITDDKPKSIESEDIDTLQSAANPQGQKKSRFLGLKLLKDPLFLAFCITIGLFTMAFQTALVFLPALGESKGLTKIESALLLSVMGATDTVARIISGAVFDITRIRPFRRYLYNIALVLISATLFLSPLGNSFASFIAIALVLGFLTGTYIAQKSVIVVDLLGKEKLIASFGMVVLFQGMGTFIGPPIAGKIRDTFQNYDFAFFFGGGITALATLVLLSSNIAFYCRNRRKTTLHKTKP